MPSLERPQRQRRDRVVRLVALDATITGMPQGLEHLDDQPELLAELVGRLGPPGLVLGVLAPGAPVGLPSVERDRRSGPALLAEQLDQHRGEAVDRVRHLA